MISETTTETIMPKTQKKNESLLEFLRSVCRNITIEPILFFYLLPSIISQLTTQNLILEKACRVDFKFNKTFCDAMAAHDEKGYDKIQEIEVQKLVSNVLALRSFLVGVFPVILMIFLGSWSDRHGRRKPILLLPIIGELISNINAFLCSYFFLEIPVLYTMLSEAIPFSLGGTWSCAYLGIYSYVSDIVPDEQKTARIGTVTILQTIAMASGISISGIIIRPLGIIWVYAVTSSMNLIALLYVVFFVKDTGRTLLVKNSTKKKPFLQDFFDIEHVKNTLRVCFKSGANNRRLRMLVLLFIVFMTIGTGGAEHALCYLYTRFKFEWDEKIFSIYNAILFAVHLIGSTIALTVFAKKLKMHDALLGVIAFTSKSLAALVYAFSPNGLVFCSGVIIEIFTGTSIIAIRSILSKIVPSHELGQSNSVIGVCEVLVPVIFVPMYTTIYNKTLSIFPGFYFLFSAGFHVVSLCLFLLFYKLEKMGDVKISVEQGEEQGNLEELLKKEGGEIEEKNIHTKT